MSDLNSRSFNYSNATEGKMNMYSKSKELMVDECSTQSLHLQLDRPLLGISHLEGSDALILLTEFCRRTLWSLHRLDSDQIGNSLRHGYSLE